MKASLVILIGIVLVLMAGGVTYYAWDSRPQLSEISPQGDAKNVGATKSIRLIFSHSMDHRSVEARLKILPAMDGIYRWEANSLIFTPNQPWPTGQVIQAQLESGSRASRWLAFAMGARSWSFTITKTVLAYLWPANGAASIYTLDPETGFIHQYTQGLTVLDYSVNKDGSTMYFSASNAQSGADLYKVERLKSDSFDSTYQPEKLLDCGEAQCRNPVISPDGKILAYEYLLPTISGRLGRVQIWTLSLPDLVANPAGQADHETVQPVWSSTGLLAYYDKTGMNYEVVNLATQERIQLPNQTGQPGVWSPDGADYLAPEISYQQIDNSYETGSSHLYRYHIQDKTYVDISGEQAVEDVEAVYSPNGQAIAFTRKFLDKAQWTPGRQIWIMSSDGVNPHPIINEADYNHYDLAWSHNGSTLAYVRFNQQDISDPPELWMVDAAGSDPVQLVIGGYSPVWIP